MPSIVRPSVSETPTGIRGDRSSSARVAVGMGALEVVRIVGAVAVAPLVLIVGVGLLGPSVFSGKV